MTKTEYGKCEKLMEEAIGKAKQSANMYIRIMEDDSRMLSIIITEALIDLVNVTEPDAWKFARENTYKETEIHPINELLGFPCMPSEQMLYVLTNRGKLRGAASIIDDAKIAEFAERHGVDKLVVFPSSIHEMLLFPQDDNISKEEIESLSKMVEEINSLEVLPEERLTIGAYPIAKNTSKHRWIESGEKFRIQVSMNQYKGYSNDDVKADFEALKSGGKSLKDLSDHFWNGEKDL